MLASITSKVHEWYELLLEKMNITDKPGDFFIAMGLYFLTGFLVGLFIKYFGKLVFLAGLIALAIGFGFQYFGVITIHYSSLSDLLGLTDTTLVADIGKAIVSWVTSHVLQTISAGLGVFVALEFA